MSLEGQQLGEFEILELLGRGGMGAVYKARQISLDRLVAIKTLQTARADDAEYILRFRQEAKAAAGLNHPNLVQVYAAGENEGVHWFAMEYVEGESAGLRLQRKGRLDPLAAIGIGIHVATALDYGWHTTSLIHRDIKPDNIFLSRDGQVKLGDLGLAKNAGQTQGLTITGASMGTPHYISPEQVMGLKSVDLRTDIYSLGCTLYHLLSGRAPFDGNGAVAIMMMHVSGPAPDLRGVWPECPQDLAAMVLKMMQKRPAERQQNYGEVIQDLRNAYNVISHRPVAQEIALRPKAETGGAKPRVLAIPQRPRAKKSNFPLYAGFGVGVLMLAAAAVFVLKLKEEKPAQAQRRVHDHAEKQSARESIDSATKDSPFVNTLGMKFVQAPIVGGPTAGQRVLFSIWDTRVQDYEVFVRETHREWPKVNFPQTSTDPATNVSWEDAQLFCQWLTAREQAAGRLPVGFRYRLPSDHEWSCAAGIGGEDPAKLPHEKHNRINDAFPWGSGWPPPAGAGNYAGEELRPALAAGKYKNNHLDDIIAGYNDHFENTSPVGSFRANRFGLFDMGGNVWQWCEDWFDKDQKQRVLRGASWANFVRPHLLSSDRGFDTPGHRNTDDGFRCVLDIPRK